MKIEPSIPILFLKNNSVLFPRVIIFSNLFTLLSDRYCVNLNVNVARDTRVKTKECCWNVGRYATMEPKCRNHKK